MEMGHDCRAPNPSRWMEPSDLPEELEDLGEEDHEEAGDFCLPCPLVPVRNENSDITSSETSGIGADQNEELRNC
jgi:hypothetical protein